MLKYDTEIAGLQSEWTNPAWTKNAWKWGYNWASSQRLRLNLTHIGSGGTELMRKEDSNNSVFSLPPLWYSTLNHLIQQLNIFDPTLRWGNCSAVFRSSYLTGITNRWQFLCFIETIYREFGFKLSTQRHNIKRRSKECPKLHLRF